MTIHYLESAQREEECAITTDRFDALVQKHALSRLPCGHMFETNAIVMWLMDNHTCPNCRAITNELAIRRVWDIDSLSQAIILRDPPFDTFPLRAPPVPREDEPVVLPAEVPFRSYERIDLVIPERDYFQLRIQDSSDDRTSFVCALNPKIFSVIAEALDSFWERLEHIIDFEAIENGLIKLVEKIENTARRMFG